MKRPNKNSVTFKEFSPAEGEAEACNAFSHDGVWFELGTNGEVRSIFIEASQFRIGTAKNLKLFKRLEAVTVFSSNLNRPANNISDTDIGQILECKSVIAIGVFCVESVSVESLEIALGCSRVTRIGFSLTPIFDLRVDDSAHFNAEVLTLHGCPIGDDSIEGIIRIEGLKRLLISSTSISKSGAIRISKSLTECTLAWSQPAGPEVYFFNGELIDGFNNLNSEAGLGGEDEGKTER